MEAGNLLEIYTFFMLFRLPITNKHTRHGCRGSEELDPSAAGADYGHSAATGGASTDAGATAESNGQMFQEMFL